MAINGSIQDSSLSSLEVRVAPERNAAAQFKSIFQNDGIVLRERKNDPGDQTSTRLSAQEILEKGRDLEYFYVLHFPKQKLAQASKRGYRTGRVEPRNAKTRGVAEQQALALANALEKSSYLRYRIRGIDGCSAEIGCRPETFATEFRFLQSLCVTNQQKVWQKESLPAPMLGCTFHAGEDFLDIVDGLRAIDEAILFLGLKRGDRLGHAIALGIDPTGYYKQKHMQLIMPKQDYLDNLVWMLFRTLDFNIDLKNLRPKWEREAEQLVRELYPDAFLADGRISLLEYYHSWRLRGNHPELFRRLGQIEHKYFLPAVSLRYQYEKAKMDPIVRDEILKGMKDKTVENEPSVRLYHDYHYCYTTRKRGQEPIVVQVGQDYSSICEKIQDAMLQMVAEKGIAIECNPSSNVLISYFERYDQHPIFKFNSQRLGTKGKQGVNLCVSINTDDQGVFDTSLENEYALLYAALSRQCMEDKNAGFGEMEIQSYLRHLQEMGKQQIFPKISGEHLESWEKDR
jgi:hypothetical protein